MALPSRKRRRIIVRDLTFHYTFGPNDEPGIAIVVQALNGSGCKLVAWAEHGNVLTPGVVVRVIELALNDGWNPQTSGPELPRRIEPRRFGSGNDIVSLVPIARAFDSA